MDCAVKCYDDYQKDSVVEAFRTEAFFLRNLCHQNLVRLFAMCSKLPNLCIVIEMMAGSLDRLLYGSTARLPGACGSPPARPSSVGT